MPDQLTVDDFLARPPGVPVIDVRTPEEFATGHIPGAINVPLFSDDERAEIGTAYKHEGRSRAVGIGLRRVGPRLGELADELLELSGQADGRLHIHCWRGGMRSASVAWLMESTFGCQVATLIGGYKAFRGWALESFRTPRQLRVLSGLTGSGKTEILKQLADLGEQAVDLEGLAGHKGSAFGNLGGTPQPTQAQFENALALAWRATAADRPVWIEDESRMIGKRVMPEPIWNGKKLARFHVIDLPDDARVSHLCTGYAGFPPAAIESCLGAIQSRLGGERAKAATEAIRSNDFAGACRIILSYYDRAYQSSLAAHPPENITRHSFPELEPRAIAAALIESCRTAP